MPLPDRSELRHRRRLFQQIGLVHRSLTLRPLRISGGAGQGAGAKADRSIDTVPVYSASPSPMLA